MTYLKIFNLFYNNFNICDHIGNEMKFLKLQLESQRFKMGVQRRKGGEEGRISYYRRRFFLKRHLKKSKNIQLRKTNKNINHNNRKVKEIVLHVANGNLFLASYFSHFSHETFVRKNIIVKKKNHLRKFHIKS